MTSTESLTALIIADITAHSALDDYTTFRINYDIMRLATLELTNSLSHDPTRPDFRYYYSDSTHDEIRNPANMIDECRQFFDADYDHDTDALLALAPLLADNINYLIDDFDNELIFNTIDELAAFIAPLC